MTPAEVLPGSDTEPESAAVGAAFIRQPGRSPFPRGRVLRPSTKMLPEQARGHNRALVLQTLFTRGQQSRADVARSSGLTRVTVSDLVTELMAEGLVVETGQREGARPGKPAILLDIDRTSFQVLGLDLSEASTFRGAVLDLGGVIVRRAEVPLAGSTGDEAVDKVLALVDTLVDMATAPVLGIGVGSPGVVDLAGVVLSAPNLGWADLPLQSLIEARTGRAVMVANDANAAVLAEHSFGRVTGDLMLVSVGHGVGAGLLLGGGLLSGSRFAAGEIGHVVVGTDGGALCSCGKSGCLETWLATPRLEARLADAVDTAARTAILREAGTRLGIALAPIVGALDLAQVVVSGPPSLLAGVLVEAARETVLARTRLPSGGGLELTLTGLGDDIVLRGAAVMVISGQLGVS